MTIQEKSFVFSARSRMLDVKGNFKQGKPNILCRRCNNEDELQSHLLTCSALCDNSIVNAGQLPDYEDIFCNNPQKIEKIAKILMKKYHLLVSDSITMCTDQSCSDIVTVHDQSCAAIDAVPVSLDLD